MVKNKKNTRKPIRVLLIDDDEHLAASLRNRARRYQVLITYKTNFEEGFKELISNQKYQAVILDGKAPITPQQTKGTEAEDFVLKAIVKLNEIKLTYHRTIPFCVHTAWYVQLEPSLRTNSKIYDKKKTAVDDSLMQEMFNYLHSEVDKLENTRIKQQYPDIFEFADRYLDDEDNGLLLNLLSGKVTPQRETLLTRLAFIRRLEESVLNIFCRECLKKDPLLFGQGGNSRGKELIDLIKEKKYAPLHVSFMTYVIYKTQSTAVNHKPPKSSEFYNYPITIYTVKTFIHALLDIILWVKETIHSKRHLE